MRKCKTTDVDLLHRPVSLSVWVLPSKMDCFIASPKTFSFQFIEEKEIINKRHDFPSL